MNIVFMGTPDFSVPTLLALHQAGHTVQAVFTQPDRPRGRGNKLVPTPVKKQAEALGIPVYTPLSLRKDPDAGETMKILHDLNPELIVVIAYGQILPVEVLTLPKYGCINLHASLLPRWRGAAPIQRAILAGDAETGVTAMQMAEGLDTGDMLHTIRTAIAPDETGNSLHDRLSELSAQAMLETLEMLQKGELRPVPQDDSAASYAAKITKDMSRLDFSAPAAEVDRTIRALTGFCMLGGKRVKLLASVYSGEASPEEKELPAGTILDTTTLRFLCGDGCCVTPLTIQAEGSKAMDVVAFLRGFHVPAGDAFIPAE